MVKRYHHGDLRRALLDAATDLLNEGVDLSLRAVARRAGVSQAAPYRHFESKEVLLAALATRGFDAMNAALDEAAVHRDVLVRVRELGVAYVQFAVEHPGWFRLMFSDELDRSAHPELVEIARAAYAALARAIEESVAVGRVRASPQDMTLMAWSLVHGMANLMLDGQGAQAGLDPTQVEATARRVLGGLVDALER